MTTTSSRLRLTRRRLLIAGGATAVAGAAAGAGLYFGALPLTVRHWAADVVRRHLPGVPIDEDGLQRFARDVSLDRELIGTKHRQKLIASFHAMPSDAWRFDGARKLAEEMERRVLGAFLVSSDFFPDAGKRTQPVRYSGILTACSNLFARYVEEA